MATSSTKRDIPEAEAEQQVNDSLERLDEHRLAELKLVSEEQGWKMDVLRAELERLEGTLTPEHPRLVRMRAQFDYYSTSREAIGLLVNESDETRTPQPTESWELSGTVSYQKLDSKVGLKVSLEAVDEEVEPLEAECNEKGFYKITLAPDALQQYQNVSMQLKVYYRTKKPIFTLEKPILIKGGTYKQNINI